MKIKWNKYTWYSKLSAVIFFIGILPAWTFYLGTQYEKTIIAVDSHEYNGTPNIIPRSQNEIIDVASNNGDSDDNVTPLYLGDHRSFLIDSKNIEQGYSSDDLHLLSQIGHAFGEPFTEVLNFPSAGGDNSGIGSSSEPQYSYTSKLTVLTKTTHGWPDIKIITKGTNINPDSNKAFATNTTHISHFNGKEYMEIGVVPVSN